MMHTTPEGIRYTIEVSDVGAVLIIYDEKGEEERVEGFETIREMLNYVNDLDRWTERRIDDGK